MLALASPAPAYPGTCTPARATRSRHPCPLASVHANASTTSASLHTSTYMFAHTTPACTPVHALPPAPLVRPRCPCTLALAPPGTRAPVHAHLSVPLIRPRRPCSPAAA